MMLIRVSTLTLCVALSLLVLTARASESPIKMVVPVSAGGPADVFARTLAINLAKRMQQPVVVENLTGASGVIGTEHVVRSTADGRTVLLTPELVASNVSQFSLRFNPVTDLTAVIQLTANEIFLVVNAESGIESLLDVSREAKKRPNGLNCGASTGALALNCERMRLVLDGRVVSIPYPGVAPVLSSLLGGHVDFAFVPQNALRPLIEGKKVRVLASAGLHAPKAPFDKLPLLKDTWPGSWMTSFTGLFVPAATPKATVDQLNRDVNAVLVGAEMHEFAEQTGNTLVGGAPDVLSRTLVREIENHARISAEAGIKSVNRK